jgi:hypothetical protein
VNDVRLADSTPCTRDAYNSRFTFIEAAWFAELAHSSCCSLGSCGKTLGEAAGEIDADVSGVDWREYAGDGVPSENYDEIKCKLAMVNIKLQ